MKLKMDGSIEVFDNQRLFCDEMGKIIAFVKLIFKKKSLIRDWADTTIFAYPIEENLRCTCTKNLLDYLLIFSSVPQLENPLNRRQNFMQKNQNQRSSHKFFCGWGSMILSKVEQGFHDHK